MADLNNIEEPSKNNTQELNKNEIPESSQNNFQDQTDLSTPCQNNFQSINNIPEPSQNNNQEALLNDIYMNDIDQGIINERLNQKRGGLEIIFYIIIFFFFISELVVDFITIRMIADHEGVDEYYAGYGLEAFLYSIFVLPFLIIFSSIILCFLKCIQTYPSVKIIVSVALCIIRGLILITFFLDGRKSVTICAIVLEILNFFYMIASVSYQIIIK